MGQWYDEVRLCDWFARCQSSSAVIWSILFQLTHAYAPLTHSPQLLEFFDQAESSRTAKILVRISDLRALKVCDLSCLIELSFLWVLLGLVSVRQEDMASAKIQISTAQTFFVTVTIG